LPEAGDGWLDGRAGLRGRRRDMRARHGRTGRRCRTGGQRQQANEKRGCMGQFHVSCVPLLPRRANQAVCGMFEAKVLWFFFTKKNRFLLLRFRLPTPWKRTSYYFS
jgi:hypothetical protein